jgi:hypothetical protein
MVHVGGREVIFLPRALKHTVHFVPRSMSSPFRLEPKQPHHMPTPVQFIPSGS